MNILAGSGVNVTALVINDWPRAGIAVQGFGHRLSSNYIGTDAAGSGGAPNLGAGVEARFTVNLTVERSVISRNGGAGVYLLQARRSTVTSNTIGLDRSGASALGNGSAGIYEDANSNTSLFNLNTIAGNASSGIYSTSSSGTRVDRNLIGLDAAGRISDRERRRRRASQSRILAQRHVEHDLGQRVPGHLRVQERSCHDVR